MATQFERLSPDPPNGAAALPAHFAHVPAPRRPDQAFPPCRRYLPGARCTRAEAARRAGVAVSTLRGWELRRLAGSGEGLGYSPYDIVRLEALARLVRAGLPAARAARRLDELAAGGGRMPG